MAACSPWNLAKLQSSQDWALLARESINTLRCVLSSATNSESGMNCRGMLGPFWIQESVNAASCFSILAGGIGSPLDMVKIGPESRPSTIRSASKS